MRNHARRLAYLPRSKATALMNIVRSKRSLAWIPARAGQRYLRHGSGFHRQRDEVFRRLYDAVWTSDVTQDLAALAPFLTAANARLPNVRPAGWLART